MTETNRTAEQIGKEAQGRRLKKGLSLSDIAVSTKIRSQFLEAIENGRLEELPQDLYARGFVRRYLEVLDSMDLWPEYEFYFSALSRQKETGSLVQYMPTQKGFQKVSKVWIFALLLLATGFSLYLIWQQRDVLSEQIGSVAMMEEGSPSSAPEEGSPPEEVTVDIPDPGKVSEEEAPSPAAESAAAGVQADTSWIPGHQAETVVRDRPAAGAGRLVISASGPCWIGVTRDDGGRIQRTLSRGDTFETDVDVRTTVRFGSVGAVSLEWGGEVIGTVGRLGEVATFEFLPDGSMKRL